MHVVKYLALTSVLMLASPWLTSSQAGLCDCCNLCSLCKPCKSSCNACEAKPAAITTACPAPACEVKPVKCCRKVKQAYTVNKTKWRLVSECVPVCKTRHERRPDPCDPCKTTKVAVNYIDYKKKCRWVCETVPKTCYRTVKVCNEVMPTAAASPCNPCNGSSGRMIQGEPIQNNNNNSTTFTDTAPSSAM